MRIAVVGPLARVEPQVLSTYAMLAKVLVYEPLGQPDADGKWRSRFVRRWDRTGANRYELELASTTHFSDGSPVLPEDIVSSLDAAGIVALRRADRLVITPKEAGQSLDHLLLNAMIFQRKAGVYLGTGPFQVVEEAPRRILLRRTVPRPGHINHVELVAFPSSRESFASVLRGATNALVMPDIGQVELLRGVPNLSVVWGPSVHALTAVFDSDRIDARERRALAGSVPVDEVAGAYGGTCEPMPAVARPAIPSRGRPLSVGIADVVPGEQRAGLALRRALGARAGPLVQLDLQQLMSGAARARVDLVIAPLEVWPPAAAASIWHTGSNPFGHYSNPLVDAAIDSGDVGRAEAELARDPPALVICRLKRVAVLDSRIRNATLGAYDMLETLPDWKVEP